MKQTLLLTLLLVFVQVGGSGCGNNIPSGHRTMGRTFYVDGERWSVACLAYLNRQGDAVTSTSLFVYPAVDPYSHSTGPGHKFIVNSGKVKVTFVAKEDTLFFYKDGNTIEKKYQELDIDVALIITNMKPPQGKTFEERSVNSLKISKDETVFNHLQPILETLIREHTKPQEPEMEEEEL